MSTIQRNVSNLGKVSQNLEAAGRALVAPGTLGKEAMGAFVALKGLSDLSKLLPPGVQKFLAPFLAHGMQNLMTSEDTAAREAVRGYSSTLAVSRGLIPDGLLEKAVGKQQKQALYAAAKSGDTATVKSILRHNKKAGVPAPPPKPTTEKAANPENRAGRLDDPRFDSPQLRAARAGQLTPQLIEDHQRKEKLLELSVLAEKLGPKTTKEDVQRIGVLVKELRSGPVSREEGASLRTIEENAKTALDKMNRNTMTAIRNMR